MELVDLLELFAFVDVQETNFITLKEFLTALTIGMVLGAIPWANLNDSNSSTGTVLTNDSLSTTDNDASKPRLQRSFSTLLVHKDEIKDMLSLIVSAYLIFDPEGKGYIERNNVEVMLEEHGHKQGDNAMLSQQRWNEMVRVFVCSIVLYSIIPNIIL